MTTSPSDRGRAATLELAAEARRMVAWYRQIAMDCANSIQAVIGENPRPRSSDVKTQIRELERSQARAHLQADRYQRDAERYERFAGIGLSSTAIGAPA